MDCDDRAWARLVVDADRLIELGVELVRLGEALYGEVVEAALKSKHPDVAVLRRQVSATEEEKPNGYLLPEVW